MGRCRDGGAYYRYRWDGLGMASLSRLQIPFFFGGQIIILSSGHWAEFMLRKCFVCVVGRGWEFAVLVRKGSIVEVMSSSSLSY